MNRAFNFLMDRTYANAISEESGRFGFCKRNREREVAEARGPRRTDACCVNPNGILYLFSIFGIDAFSFAVVRIVEVLINHLTFLHAKV